METQWLLILISCIANIYTTRNGVHSEELTRPQITLAAINQTLMSFDLEKRISLFNRHNEDIKKMILKVFEDTRDIREKLNVLEKANSDLKRKVDSSFSQVIKNISSTNEQVLTIKQHANAVEGAKYALQDKVDSLSSQIVKNISDVSNQVWAVKERTDALATINNALHPCRWVQSENGSIPPNAVEGGYNSDGEKLYVVKVDAGEAIIPGRLVPSQGKAYTAWSWTEKTFNVYEVLCDCVPRWQWMTDGRTPKDVIVAGPFLVGRAWHGNSLIPGRVHWNKQACYYSYNGKEFMAKESEVMVV